MRKKCRTILVSLLVICMSVMLLPVNVYAGGNFGRTGEVHISSGDMIASDSEYCVFATTTGYNVLNNEKPVSKWKDWVNTKNGEAKQINLDSLEY